MTDRYTLDPAAATAQTPAAADPFANVPVVENIVFSHGDGGTSVVELLR